VFTETIGHTPALPFLQSAVQGRNAVRLFELLQMYVTSIMFGYFLRRLDSRFQLERSAGLLGMVDPKEDAISRLERLFNQADSMELADSPDSPSTSSRDTSSSGTSTSDSGMYIEAYFSIGMEFLSIE
jgi:hypothetical protein